jgi:hypothetical protein
MKLAICVADSGLVLVLPAAVLYNGKRQAKSTGCDASPAMLFAIADQGIPESTKIIGISSFFAIAG